MLPFTIKELGEACGSRPVCGPGEENTVITSVCTDSRKVLPGAIFGALKGEKSDGHDYIASVADKAACVLCERPPENTNIPYILVPSTLKALQNIAKYVLRKADIPVIAITGSVGKTSTKEMTASVLSQKYTLLKTEANYNNALGLPLTVFNIKKEDELAVLEHGVSRFGEMSVLADISRPDVCMFTNIGDVHLEDLVDREGVFRAKGEMFDYMAKDAKLIFNGDDAILGAQKTVKGIRPCFYGMGSGCDVRAENIRLLGFSGSCFTIVTPKERFEAKIPAPGRHMISNALAAAAAGYLFGLSSDEIVRGLEGYQPVGGRFNICDTGKYTLINDCYNASPVSVKSSLENLSFARGRKAAILGDMFELGQNSERLHAEVGEHFGKVKIDVLCCAGKNVRAVYEAAKKADPGLEAHMFATKEELIKDLPGILKEKDTILVKASHSCGFEEIVKAIKEM